MFWPFKKKEEDFKKKFFATKSVKIDGIPFVIRKINVLDYLEGAKVLSETFAIYKNGKDPASNIQDFDMAHVNKLKKYLTDVICAGVVKPKFTREETTSNEDEIPIKELFTDWVLAQKLSQEIFDFTHGKKK